MSSGRSTIPPHPQTSSVEKPASPRAKTDTGKENQRPILSNNPVVPSHETEDHQKEFGEWKGSSNPSHPKWAGPPHLHGPPVPDDVAGASGGPRPGMGMWGSG